MVRYMVLGIKYKYSFYFMLMLMRVFITEEVLKNIIRQNDLVR